MKAGIRELKARLSEYVKRAGKEERIRAIDRGRPATLPVTTGGASAVDRGIEEGWITPPSRSGMEPIERCKVSMSTSEALAEDRG